MENNSWIKLYRKFNHWEWKAKPNYVALFIHLLINVNYQDKPWQGIIIKAGQVVTTREKLALRTGLSEQNVRTILKSLKSTNEINIESNPSYTLITLLQWHLYQTDNQETNQQLTNDQPTINKPLTTTKESNKYKKEKKDINNFNKELAVKSTFDHEAIANIEAAIKKITGLPMTSGEKAKNCLKLLLKKLKENFPNQDNVLLTTQIIQLAHDMEDNWHSTKAHDPEHLYYKWQEIVQKAKSQKTGKSSSRIGVLEGIENELIY